MVTIPEFAYTEGQKRLAQLPKAPDHKERWNADAERMRIALRDSILGGFPPRGPLQTDWSRNQAGVSIRITTEPGIRATGEVILPPAPPAGTAIMVTPRSNVQQPFDRIAKDESGSGSRPDSPS